MQTKSSAENIRQFWHWNQPLQIDKQMTLPSWFVSNN
jgi:hypothetical protein